MAAIDQFLCHLHPKIGDILRTINQSMHFSSSSGLKPVYELLGFISMVENIAYFHKYANTITRQICDITAKMSVDQQQ